MNVALVEQLTGNELDQFAAELDLAIDLHVRWLAQVNRTLIFGDSPQPQDVAENPHLQCHFGRWYHNMDDHPLLDIPEFAAIGATHARQHDLARRMLTARCNDETLCREDYDRFVDTSDELLRLITFVRQGIKQNLGLASRLMAKVFENATEGVVITTPEGVILNVNRAFSEVTGYSADEVLGKTPRLLNSGRQSRDFYTRMWMTLHKTGIWQGEIWNRRKNGGIYLEWLTVSSLKNEQDDVTHFVGIFSDITTEKENEERLYHLAHFDPLTELPNRVLFQDRFKQALMRARRNRSSMAVMFLDLDGFKKVNDRFGHAAGDALLEQVAKRLTAQLRTSDTIARLGGDEFAIILPDLDDLTGISVVARKIINAVGLPFALSENRMIQITTSIGISLYPQDGTDSDHLIHRADTAMYVAKERGKNQFCFYAREME